MSERDKVLEGLRVLSRASLIEMYRQAANDRDRFKNLARAESERLDKMERAMRAGHSIDAYGWDDEKNEWGKAGIGVLFKDSDGDRWSGADLLADNVRDVIDELEEQDHE